MEKAIREGISMGALLDHSLWVAWLSEVCRLAGHGEEAWQHARQALDLARQQKERVNEALALYQLGVVQANADPLISRRPQPTTSRPWPCEALGMRPLRAHCHHGLGRLYARPAVLSRPAPPWPPPSTSTGPWT